MKNAAMIARNMANVGNAGAISYHTARIRAVAALFSISAKITRERRMHGEKIHGKSC